MICDTLLFWLLSGLALLPAQFIVPALGAMAALIFASGFWLAGFLTNHEPRKEN